MPKLVALDDGHGIHTAGKRTPIIPELGRSIRENEFNRAVVRLLKKELERSGFDTLLVASTDEDVSLKNRVDLANTRRADIYVSIHYNAFDGSFSGSNPSGIEIYVYPGTLNKESGKLANAVGKYLRQGTKQNWRGIKEANFYVLRESMMPAILTENGYMDNKNEALLMVDENFQLEVAIEHAKGICEYFNVSYVSAADNKSETGFTDVSPNASYAEAAKRAKDLGILKGYPDGRFLPDQTLTRKEFVLALMRLYDKLR
ncbi:N-acetylmuramoyl-L-alanine amidase [Halobacillus litoralis]|uniref:N-acetylmuramoyl-L-alanine amidase n=1 Tax=Halobacillus litoralis TaxID=45668 RepID=UPI001CD3F997|nr:N-acetylmuramoyl-L-alanine amidase [Halobacillus litoralis]MCA0970848.1 N-acetylmuramoyl-L-alanine amidase [Halobacillus litoralis]